jgi:hypothetical protein
LCVLLSDLPGAGRVVPAKIFEYFASKRPIFAIAPPGELWELLENHPSAFRLQPTDIEGIAARLAVEMENRAKSLGRLEGWTCDAFDRRQQAGELASILTRAATHSA